MAVFMRKVKKRWINNKGLDLGYTDFIEMIDTHDNGLIGAMNKGKKLKFVNMIECTFLSELESNEILKSLSIYPNIVCDYNLHSKVFRAFVEIAVK